jgi:hypothetical protein
LAKADRSSTERARARFRRSETSGLMDLLYLAAKTSPMGVSAPGLTEHCS